MKKEVIFISVGVIFYFQTDRKYIKQLFCWVDWRTEGSICILFVNDEQKGKKFSCYKTQCTYAVDEVIYLI